MNLFSLDTLLATLAGFLFPYMAEWLKNKVGLTDTKLIRLLLGFVGVGLAYGGSLLFVRFGLSEPLTTEAIWALGFGLTETLAGLTYVVAIKKKE